MNIHKYKHTKLSASVTKEIIMQSKLFPICCTSAYCGKINCPISCKNLAELTKFKAWVEATSAIKTDPIWCPLVYTATTK